MPACCTPTPSPAVSSAVPEARTEQWQAGPLVNYFPSLAGTFSALLVPTTAPGPATSPFSFKADIL